MKCLTCGTEMECKDDNGMGTDFEVCSECSATANIMRNNDGSAYKAEWFKGNTFKYTLGLECGESEDDPEFHIEFVRTLYAKDLEEARDKWAKLTGEDKKKTWDKQTQTSFGANIRVLSSNDKRIEEKEYYR